MWVYVRKLISYFKYLMDMQIDKNSQEKSWKKKIRRLHYQITRLIVKLQLLRQCDIVVRKTNKSME